MDQGLLSSPGKEELNFHSLSYLFGAFLLIPFQGCFLSPLSVLTTSFPLWSKGDWTRKLGVLLSDSPGLLGTSGPSQKQKQVLRQTQT